jgi:hypothetical protein
MDEQDPHAQDWAGSGFTQRNEESSDAQAG